MNKRGFAISVVLYTMVILIIGIFYLLLGIVRNRYNVGSDLKQVVIDNINLGAYPDNELPSCSFVSGPSNSSINVSSTATYVLECTDNKGGFSDSEIVASDFTLTSSGVVTIQTPVAESIENGFRYTITVTGKKAGTTSLKLNEGAVSDTAGNGNVSVTSNSITVKSSSSSTQSYPRTGSFTRSCSGTNQYQEMSTSSDCVLSSVKIEYYLDGALVKTTNIPTGTSTAVYYTLTLNGEGNWRYRITAVDVCGKTDIVANSYVIPDDCP